MKIASRRQEGAILMVLAMILFMAGSSYIITVLNTNVVDRFRDEDIGKALVAAKEAIIAFAVMHGDYYGAAGSGPGHLFCPDTDNDGLENTPCNGNALGRLPQAITLPSGDIFALSDHGAAIDQQIWYSVAPAFKRAPASVMNTSINGTLTLDGQTGIAVVLIAPGDALQGQSRSSNNATNYLESANTTVPDFTQGNSMAVDSFNDRVLAIRSSEIHTPVSARVAERIRLALAAYHTTNGSYPADQVTFAAALAGAGVMPAWYAANAWPAVTTYTPVTANTASLQFTGCAITFTLEFGVTAMNKSVSRC